MKNIIISTNNISIKNKLFVSYIALILLPLFLITITLTLTYQKSTYEKISTQTAINLEKINSQFSESFRSVGSILNQALADGQLEAIALTHYTNTLEVFQSYYDYSNFDSYLKYYNAISSIKLYCYNETILDNGQFIFLSPSLRSQDWFKKVYNNQGKILWQYDTINSSTPAYHLTYELRGTSTFNKLGILSIELNRAYFDNLVANEYFDTFVLEPNGQIIGSNVSDLSLLDTLTLPANASNNSNSPIDITYNNQKAKLIYKQKKIDYLNLELTFLSIIPSSFITQDMLRSLLPVSIILLISGSLSILLIIFFTTTISRRLYKLCLTMNRVAEGDFSVPIEIDGTDEFSQVYVNLHKMILNINTLVNEVYHTNLQKQQLLIHQKEIQLQMLSSQINPHFLFNMLESIRMKAHMEGMEDLADIIEALSFMIRRNLDMRKELVPISYEVEILETYLKLIHFRFQDKISYTINVPEHLKDLSIPYLIIQPLVENAIIHGLEPKATAGHIHINIYDSSDDIYIEVIDNGVGVDDSKLKQLLQSLTEEVGHSNKHIGLKNIDTRIKLLYGTSYGLNIKSILGLGTSLKLILPKLTTQGEQIC